MKTSENLITTTIRDNRKEIEKDSIKVMKKRNNIKMKKI